MYGRRTPEEVHSILVKFNASYIILEDSICLAASRGGCRLPDLIDVSNGVVGISNTDRNSVVLTKLNKHGTLYLLTATCGCNRPLFGYGLSRNLLTCTEEETL